MKERIPLKVGITGGIGTGKSLICKIFSTLGVPVFDADAEAKWLMQNDMELKQALIEAFGTEIYLENGTLHRSHLAGLVFENPEKLLALNSLVHPAVIRHGDKWNRSQYAPYTLKEAALLFESGSYKQNDYNILVTAPLQLRIERTMQRDGASREQVLARVKNQMPDEDKAALADFILVNDGRQALIPQVLHLHQVFLNKADGRE